MRIVIPGERPVSWNIFYAGKHWRARAQEAERVHLLVRAFLSPDTHLFAVPVNIRITAYFKGRPVDADNICGKFYIDGLIGWVIVDDSPRYVASVTTAARLDRAAPRLEIEIVPE